MSAPLQVALRARSRLGEAVLLGLRSTLRRLFGRRALLVVPIAAALALVGAIIERSAGTAGAVDRALDGTFGLIVPLLAFFVTAEATRRDALRMAVWPVARFGASRRGVALGALVASTLVAAAAGALVAAITVIGAASGAAAIGAGLAGEIATSAWIAILTSAAYVGWFGLGATWWRRGRGRWAPLVADFLLGGSTGVGAALLPRANAANLLGDVPPLGLSQPASLTLLFLMWASLVAVASARCGD